MNWRNVGLIFRREVLDQLRDRRTLFMVLVLPVLLYPALGIGMVQLTVLFREQPRTVVLLGASALPNLALTDGSHFEKRWFRHPEDSAKLTVISDAATTSTDPAIVAAETFRAPLDRWVALEAQREEAQRLNDVTSLATLEDERKVIVATLQAQFATAPFQALILIPPDFSSNLAAMQTAVREHRGESAASYARPIVLHNSADEKSLIAYSRVERVMLNWEQALLKETLVAVGLPASLPTPVAPIPVDVAAAEEIAANIWSKLFPALLMMMALTGAFNPAVDLGAGEKERGTMETLLICPATRTEIVLGKFFTVMTFSVATVILNLSSLGFTGKYMVSLTAGGPMSRIGDLSLPPLTSLAWVLIVLFPLSALFSALCLALATFAKSSKEGQYYLTPLLMVTLGLTMFCLSPAVEMQPFYSVIPVMGPALLLKGLLMGGPHASALLVYVVPVLFASVGYSVLALWWAIDQFGSEAVLFREAERFDLRLWIQHLLRDKEPTPSFSEGVFAFVLIMLLQFLALRVLQAPLAGVEGDARTLVMMQILVMQQLVIIATPPLFMGVMLTTSVVETFRLRLPRLSDLALAGLLAVTLHPLTLEFSASLQWFFPPLPDSVAQALGAMTSDSLPWWLPLLVFALAPAVCEEIAFRGFILSGLGQTGRQGLAIVLSALAFGIMHLIPQQVLNASLLGLVLGLIATRTRSLWPCILFHALYNGLEVNRNRWGKDFNPKGWELFFQVEGGLRYQPALLAICALIAAGLLTWLIRRPEADVPSAEAVQAD